MKNHGNQLKTMKNHETTLKNMETNQKPWQTMKPPWKTMETNQKPWKWLVTLLTQDPNWPPLIQKRHVTDAGPQLTSLDPKTSRDRRRAPTDLLWSKNVMWQTWGPNWPFRCLDLGIIYMHPETCQIFCNIVVRNWHYLIAEIMSYTFFFGVNQKVPLRLSSRPNFKFV